MRAANSRGKRNRSRTAGVIILSALYLTAIFAGFLAPYDYREQVRREPSAPPTSIRFFDAEGTFHLRPFIYRRQLMDARNGVYQEDASRIYPLAFLARGSSYNLIGLANTGRHLFGVGIPAERTSSLQDVPKVHLLGTDQLGRDRFSRLLYAIRFSLIVSPAGTILACLIGIAFGSISGYAGSHIDSVMMGVADTVIALPALILILAARAAFPPELPPMTAALLLIGIFALTGWAEMARLTRSLVLATKRLDYVTAARSIGLTELQMLRRHILPNIATPLLIQATLLLPVFLLAEVALSFLGVGLQEPEPSLGNMLSSAGDLSLLRNSPFLMLAPAIPIFLFVLGVRLIAGRSASLKTRY